MRVTYEYQNHITDVIHTLVFSDQEQVAGILSPQTFFQDWRPGLLTFFLEVAPTFGL